MIVNPDNTFGVNHYFLSVLLDELIQLVFRFSNVKLFLALLMYFFHLIQELSLACHHGLLYLFRVKRLEFLAFLSSLVI